jgi:peptide/nickel transport system substrate-binding protein
MKTKSLWFSLLKIFMGLLIVSILGMLYWSNSLIESNLIDLRKRIDQLEKRPLFRKDTTLKKQAATRVDSKEPNLLTKDAFFEKTLPQMLGPDFIPQGELRQAILGRPKTLMPFTPWYDANVFQRYCGITLATSHFGIYDSLAPSLALRLEDRIDEKTGQPEIWAFLRQDVYWKPLTSEMFGDRIELAPWFEKQHPVTAHDVKFFYDLMMNPFNQESKAVSLRTYYKDLESVDVVDDYTLKMRWKTKEVDGVERAKYMSRNLTGGLQALAGFVYKYFSNGERIIEDEDEDTYRTSSLFAQNFSNHFARNIIPSSGEWSFQSFTDKKIEFARNADFFNPLAALVNRRVVFFRDSPDAPWQDFKAGNIDYTSLRPDQLIEYEQFLKSPLYERQHKEGNGIERLDYLARQFAYLGWNARKPFFKTAQVRRALTHAIDRQRIIDGILNGMAVELTGPIFLNSAEYNKSLTPLKFSPRLAREILEKEGWFDTDGDGIREKEIEGLRIPFRFSLTYYVKNSTTKALCEYVQSALKDIGIDVQLDGIDIADLSQKADDKSFDAVCMAWALGTPPDDPRQLWYSTGADQKGSSNLVSFKNEEADSIINALDYEYDKEKRLKLYHRFHEIIFEEQPYTFLFIPKAILLYRSYVNGVFIPVDRQDLIPGADVSEPDSNVFWLNQ